MKQGDDSAYETETYNTIMVFRIWRLKKMEETTRNNSEIGTRYGSQSRKGAVADLSGSWGTPRYPKIFKEFNVHTYFISKLILYIQLM